MSDPSGTKASRNVRAPFDIQDRKVRAIGITFFGLVIPNASGLIDNGEFLWWQLIPAYLYFMFVAFCIWQGNRSLLFYIERRYNWFVFPVQKIALLLAANVLYTALIVTALLSAWYIVIGRAMEWPVIYITIAICVLCVIFITHVYETIFLIKQREIDILENEQLERARMAAQLEALKNQIDPHFMFNSLNTLTHLIDKDADLAKGFTESLAEIYRYILKSKDQKLVWLQEEVSFFDKYLSLLKIRFEDTLIVSKTLEGEADYLIPPISIFFALENVVKHNEISREHPMTVEVVQGNEELTITNRIRPKKMLQASSKIGLKNLNERFELLTGNGIRSSSDDMNFELTLPLLKVG